MTFVFFTEEPSMEWTLKNIIPKFLPVQKFRIIPHEGKQDLEKSIPRKLRAWKDNSQRSYKFIVILDKDSGDCVKIKSRIKQLCIDNGRSDTLIRIAIHELESWFLGDLSAVDAAYNTNFAKNCKKRKFRNPDRISSPSDEIKKMIKNYSKIDGARRISCHLSMDNNSSESFNVFVTGLKRFIEKVQ
jgi:hypothetical protein